MRRSHRSNFSNSRCVSIHAPRAGCDTADGSVEGTEYRFQFTHPVRGATRISFITEDKLEEFQFTHPVRGATNPLTHSDVTSAFQFTHPVRGATNSSPCGVRRSWRFNSRTPCGVRLPSVCRPTASASFNSRTPCGVRQLRQAIDNEFAIVSIHAPRAGCDYYCSSILSGAYVSIHAPRAGCDQVPVLVLLEVLCFNSRTPCGVRPETGTAPVAD